MSVFILPQVSATSGKVVDKLTLIKREDNHGNYANNKIYQEKKKKKEIGKLKTLSDLLQPKPILLKWLLTQSVRPVFLISPAIALMIDGLIWKCYLFDGWYEFTNHKSLSFCHVTVFSPFYSVFTRSPITVHSENTLHYLIVVFYRNTFLGCMVKCLYLRFEIISKHACHHHWKKR